MAHDVAHLQLPTILRKPRMVWPGLDRMGLHHKSIAGDGNCLFASLADQLYGSPERHHEIRAVIIDHMRTYRPLYEDFVHKDDVVQRRATRSTTESIRKNATDDAFSDYLGLMSKPGAYGGQPELQAFVRAYDQDVVVHLPPETDWNTLSMPYNNDCRESEAETKPPLHICYGGDETRTPHYDSSQRSDLSFYDKPLTTRSKFDFRPILPLETQLDRDLLTSRGIRNLKSDPNRDMMHELVTRGSKDLRANFDFVNNRDRARSPSVTSHRSTSSKRSFEDDGDQPRMTKRADRKRSLRSRAALSTTILSQSLPINIPSNQVTSSGPPTPTSSQGSDVSSDRVDQTQEDIIESSASSPPAQFSFSEDTDSQEYLSASQSNRPRTGIRSKGPSTLRRASGHQISNLASERTGSSLKA